VASLLQAEVGRNLHIIRRLTPPKGWSELAGKIARSRSSIKERVLRSIIDFSSIIRNRQFAKDACRDCSVAGDRSDFLILTGSRKRLWRVFPIILKAAMPVGAARKTGLPFPAAVAISCILAHVFRSVKVFPVPATPSTFRRSCRGRLLFGLISLV
jgi:hypothetical protein